MAHRRGDADEARSEARAALADAAEIDDPAPRIAARNNLADLLHRAGQREEALDYLKQAVALFAEVGEPERHEPEIWKLVDW